MFQNTKHSELNIPWPLGEFLCGVGCRRHCSACLRGEFRSNQGAFPGVQKCGMHLRTFSRNNSEHAQSLIHVHIHGHIHVNIHVQMHVHMHVHLPAHSLSAILIQVVVTSDLHSGLSQGGPIWIKRAKVVTAGATFQFCGQMRAPRHAKAACKAAKRIASDERVELQAGGTVRVRGLKEAHRMDGLEAFCSVSTVPKPGGK